MEITAVTSVPAEFASVKVVRSGGFAGFRDEVQIDRTMVAQIDEQVSGRRTHKLDEAAAVELMHAVDRMLAAGDLPTAPATGADTYEYTIELVWNGAPVQFHAHQLGVPEALAGIVAMATRLIDEQPAS